MTSASVGSATLFSRPMLAGLSTRSARFSPAWTVRLSCFEAFDGPVSGAAPPPPAVWLVRETAPAYGILERAPLPDDSEEITSLGEQIMTLAEHLHAETHRWLMLIAEFDRREGWKLYGFGSCAEWLAFSTRLDKVTARETVRVARALGGLPRTSAAMSRGELSFSQVRALTRVADDENELELLELARSTSASGLERLVRSYRRLDREDEAELEARRHATRYVSVFPDDEGMYQLRARLDPEAGALAMRVFEAAMDALYHGSVPETTPEQRRADAFALILERVLAVGFEEAGGEHSSGTGLAPDARGMLTTGLESGASAESRAEASADFREIEASASSCPNGCARHAEGGASAESSRGGTGPMRVPACKSERYMVVLHVDAATLTDGNELGRSEMEDGTRVSAESSRRLSCDASVVRVLHRKDERDTHVEGRRRTVPLRLRRALEIRDRGCRFPGCGSRYTDAHHIRHWADGGATRMNNLILLCKTHHRLLHEGGFKLEPNPDCPDHPTFISPRGVRIPEVPPRMTVNGRPIGGRKPDGTVDRPQWERDVSLALYLRAMESLS